MGGHYRVEIRTSSRIYCKIHQFLADELLRKSGQLKMFLTSSTTLTNAVTLFPHLGFNSLISHVDLVGVVKHRRQTTFFLTPDSPPSPFPPILLPNVTAYFTKQVELTPVIGKKFTQEYAIRKRYVDCIS